MLMARSLGLLAESSRTAIDATGFDAGHVSRYYVMRQGRKEKFSRYAKLTVVCDLSTHFWLGFHICRGPCVDSPQFKPAITQAAQNHRIDAVLGDKGYDAEHNHQLCRDQLGIPSTIIPARRNTNRTKQWPKTPYRREMKQTAIRAGYGQRWQVESAFSRHKRLFGAALRARTWLMQKCETALRALLHNVALLAAA